jgi:hypothetical protein
MISLGKRKLPRIAGAKSAKEAASIRRQRIQALRERLRDERGELDLSQLRRPGSYGAQLPRDIRKLSESHITRSGETVLGHYRGAGRNYIEKAKERGASYFDLGPTFDTLSEAQQKAANFHFLDKIAASGDKVVLSVSKTKMRKTGPLKDELDYLLNEKNYRWVNQWTLKPR